MTGYMNPDGSELVGGQLPSGQGQALQLDASGNLKVNVEAGGGGGGGGAVTAAAGAFADGAITTIGTEADAAWGLSGSATLVALLKKLDLLLQNVAYDNTSELKTSLYGKHSSAGDTAVAVDSSGNVMETLATLIAGEDLLTNRTVVELRYSYYNITATGTTTVKSGAGFIRSLSVNNPSQLISATTATTIKLYDNTSGSGTLIGTLTLPPSASLAAALPFTILFDDQFLTGLTVVITPGTSGVWTPDLTVNYR